jgi:protease secretion system membrane fusion protein
MNLSSEAVAESAAPDDVARVARQGLWILGLALGGFLVWAALAPLDEGVPASALVSVETQRKAVQHLSGGIVREVRVREGQRVSAGEVLFKLDQAAARANYENVRQHYLGARALQARLQAEQQGRTELSLHPDLQAALQDPLILSQLHTQQALRRTRAQTLEAELRSLEESVQGQRAIIESTTAMRISREAQQRLLREELQHTRGLVTEGYAPRNRQLELERNLADVDFSLSDLRGRQEQAKRAVAELQQRMQHSQHNFRQEVETQLSTVTQDVQADAEKLRALSDELARTEIAAPSSGQVVGLAVQTVGGVIQSGQKLLDIVPEGESLLLDVRIAPHLIDKVRTGLVADVRFSTFSNAPMLVVEGRVETVSTDLLTDPQAQVSYYLARVALTPQGLKSLQGRQLQPGMPAEVVIKTGERSLLNYLLHPLIKRMAASLKET